MFFGSQKKDRNVFQSDTIDFEQARQQIRELAYQKWENAGCPEGRAEEFWLEAEREISGENTEI